MIIAPIQLARMIHPIGNVSGSNQCNDGGLRVTERFLLELVVVVAYSIRCCLLPNRVYDNRTPKQRWNGVKIE